MQGITLHEADILIRALDLLVEIDRDELPESELDYIYSLDHELRIFKEEAKHAMALTHQLGERQL